MNEVHEDSPKDPQVSEFYRKHATEQPSTAVDERILAAARVAVADRTSRKVPGWWQRWRTPLALGTTLVLTLSLALLHERRPVVLAPEGRAASQKAAVGRAAPAAATSSEQAADSRLAEAVKRDSGDAQPSLPVEVLRPMVPPSGRVPAERIARLPASNAVGESSEAALPAAAVPHNGTAGDWSSDVCSPDLSHRHGGRSCRTGCARYGYHPPGCSSAQAGPRRSCGATVGPDQVAPRGGARGQRLAR